MADRPSYAVGEIIDVPAHAFNAADHTLLIFARSSCPACQRAKPALASIVAATDALNSSVALVSSAELPSAEEEIQYARELGIEASEVLATDMRALRIARVPAVALVDNSGRVIAFEEGLSGDGAFDAILLKMQSMFHSQQ